MQIYKNIPIITAQPSKKDQTDVKHFLYGFAEDDYNLSFGNWIKMLQNILIECENQNIEPIILGGTMMYAYLLLKGFSDIPAISITTKQKADELYNEIGHEEFLHLTQKLDANTPQDKQRLLYNYCLITSFGNTLSYYSTLPQIKIFKENEIQIIIPEKTRQQVYEVCNNRFLDMINDGLIEEVESVMQSSHLPIKRATGFVYIKDYILGYISKELMIEKSQQETRNYAKRQIIWLRKFAKEGIIYNNTISNL